MKSIPAASTSFSFCTREVSRGGASRGRRKASGWGSKVIIADGACSSRARATTRSRIARWPRWMPS